MADQQPAEATTDPPTTVTEDERAYRMPNSTWHMPSGHMQPPAITDTGYHMPQVTVSPAWGGSSHLPPLLPADGYGTRIEPGHRTSIHSGSYTQGGLETGDSYGSTYQLDSFRRLGVGYRVSGAIQPARPGIVPGDYARTCLGQGSYTRNYVSTYSDTRTNCEHGSHYRTITEPNDYSRANVEQNNYGRSQTGSEFYVRGNPLSASFDSESGTRIDNEQEMPRDDQASSTLSAVISCSRMYNSQDDKIPDNGDARCYSGSADTMTEISLTSLEAASKSDPNLSHDARVSTRAESELESSYQTENVAKLNHSSVSRMDGTCCDMRSPSGLENSCHGSPQADVDVNASHISGQKQRELEVTLNANGDLASRSMPCKDLSDEMSVSQKNEIQLFINDNPGMSLERIAEQFSKKWNMDLTSNAIHQVVGEGENKVQDLSEEMKNAIMSYKQEHQNSSFRDMANYFSKKWCMMLNKDVIASVLSEHSPEVDLVANENSNNEDAKEKPNCLEDELEISCEKKRELILFKTSHCSSSAEEMASYFSEKWNASISKETVLSILNGSENQTSDSSQNIEHSPQHQHSSSPSCSPKDKSTVSSNDISGEASHYGGYDNNIAKLVPVTVEEAREGLMKAIAYFMANPSIADGHVHTLWNILHYIDSQDESTVLSEKDPISADESSPHDSYAEIVNIKQELSEAECNADAFSENVKTEAFHMSTKSGSCQLIKVRSPVNSKRASIRRKLTKKKRVMSVKNSSKDKKDPLENEISINNVKVDVDQRLRCPDCDENFVEFTQLMDHITKHSEEKLILSHSCGDGLHLGNKSPVSRSRTRGQGHGRHRCVMGENTSQNLRDDDNPGTSVKHKRRIKLQNCMQCGRQFNDYSNFRRHLRLHAGLKPHKCSTCGLSFIESNALKKHMRTHTGEKPYLCTTCGKRVTTLAGLQSHARLHTGEKPFKCTICAKDFAQSSSLKRHMVIHTGERPYGCLQCGKNFPRSEDLKMHIRTHTGLKPYKCLVCGKCFIKSSYLHKHARIHTGEKPYKCTTCGEAFAQSDVLAKHIRVHTGERPYCCTACGKTFTQSGSLHHHMKMHKQHDLSPQRRKAPFSLSNQTEKNPDNLSESVTTLPDGEPVKFPALTQRLSNSSVTAQMTVFPNTSRPYLSQWRPY